MKLMKLPDGSVEGSYELFEKGSQTLVWKGVLSAGNLYSFQPEQEALLKFSVTSEELLPYLNAALGPFISFALPGRAERDFRLKMLKRDEWYTYLEVLPRRQAYFARGRIAVLNQPATDLERGLPRELWYYNGITEHKYEIRKWRRNVSDAVTAEEFKVTAPPGWQVHE